MSFGDVARPRHGGLKNKSPPLAGRQLQGNILFATGGGVKSLEKPHCRSVSRVLFCAPNHRFHGFSRAKSVKNPAKSVENLMPRLPATHARDSTAQRFLRPRPPSRTECFSSFRSASCRRRTLRRRECRTIVGVQSTGRRMEEICPGQTSASNYYENCGPKG